MKLEIITSNNRVNPNYGLTLGTDKKNCALTQALDLNVQQLAEKMIYVGGEQPTYKNQGNGWEKIEILHNQQNYYLAFFRNTTSKKLTHIQLNCPIYLFQDLLHSLPQEQFLQLHAALLTTPFEVRKMGRLSQQYRKMQRECVDKNKLIELQNKYQELDFVKKQMELASLKRVHWSQEIYYIKSPGMSGYDASFEKDAGDIDFIERKKQIDQQSEKIEQGNDTDNFACIKECIGDLTGKRVLDVGFGKTFSLHMEILKQFPSCELYGLEPDLLLWKLFVRVMKNVNPNAEQRYFSSTIEDFLEEQPLARELLGSFDLITIFLCPLHPEQTERNVRVLHALKQFLKPDGRLLITCYAIDRFDPLYLKPRESLQCFLEKVFQKIERAERNHPLNKFVYLATGPIFSLENKLSVQPDLKAILKAWDTSFTEPIAGNKEFTYLVTAVVHGIARQAVVQCYKDLKLYDPKLDFCLWSNPEKLNEKKIIHASVVTHNKPFVHTDFGFILATPSANIIKVAPKDLLSAGEVDKLVLQPQRLTITPAELVERTLEVNEVLIRGKSNFGATKIIGVFTAKNGESSIPVKFALKHRLPLIESDFKAVAYAQLNDLEKLDELAAQENVACEAKLKSGFFKKKPEEKSLSPEKIRIIGQCVLGDELDAEKQLASGQQFMSWYQASIDATTKHATLKYFLDVFTEVVCKLHSQHKEAYQKKSSEVSDMEIKILIKKYLHRIGELNEQKAQEITLQN